MNQTIKRYIVSSLVTFLTGFLLVIYMQIDSFTLEAFRDGSVVGIIFAAIRAGVKGVIELFLRRQGAINSQ